MLKMFLLISNLLYIFLLLNSCKRNNNDSQKKIDPAKIFYIDNSKKQYKEIDIAKELFSKKIYDLSIIATIGENTLIRAIASQASTKFFYSFIIDWQRKKCFIITKSTQKSGQLYAKKEIKNNYLHFNRNFLIPYKFSNDFILHGKNFEMFYQIYRNYENIQIFKIKNDTITSYTVKTKGRFIRVILEQKLLYILDKEIYKLDIAKKKYIKIHELDNKQLDIVGYKLITMLIKKQYFNQYNNAIKRIEGSSPRKTIFCDRQNCIFVENYDTDDNTFEFGLYRIYRESYDKIEYLDRKGFHETKK